MSRVGFASLISIALAGAVLTGPAQAAEPSWLPGQPGQCVTDGPDVLQGRLEPCAGSSAGAPGAPTQVTTRITGPQVIRVRWGEPVGKPKARTYAVYAFVGDEGELICQVNKRRCVAQDLEVDTEYVFYVVAINGKGRGAAATSAPVYLPADASPDGFR